MTRTPKLQTLGTVLCLALTAVPTTSFALTDTPAQIVVAQASDTTLTCSQLSAETVKVSQIMMASMQASQSASSLTAAAPAQSTNVNAVANALQNADLQARIADIQMKGAAAGVNTTAMTAGLQALAAAKNSGQGMGAALQDTAASMVADQLAARIPGGALVSGLVGGLFSHKKKPAQVAADTPNTMAIQSQQTMQLGQQRISFLQGLQASKKCI